MSVMYRGEWFGSTTSLIAAAICVASCSWMASCKSNTASSASDASLDYPRFAPLGDSLDAGAASDGAPETGPVDAPLTPDQQLCQNACATTATIQCADR